MQIGLKDYDTSRDKRFCGSIRLPHTVWPSMKICLIGDAKHIEEAKGLDIDVIDIDGLKKFNKE